jgi:hypothetical protein
MNLSKKKQFNNRLLGKITEDLIFLESPDQQAKYLDSFIEWNRVKSIAYVFSGGLVMILSMVALVYDAWMSGGIPQNGRCVSAAFVLLCLTVGGGYIFMVPGVLRLIHITRFHRSFILSSIE